MRYYGVTAIEFDSIDLSKIETANHIDWDALEVITIYADRIVSGSVVAVHRETTTDS